MAKHQPDLVIAGGSVVDGTGQPPVRADVAISDGRIADVGRIDCDANVPSLDATDLYVTPGFIDIHSHSDFTLLVDPRAVSAISQGVTLEVVGNCGHGCAPIVDPQLARSVMYGSQIDYDIDWRNMGEYLDRLEAARPAVNVMTLVPNGLLRLAAVTDTDRPADSAELQHMKSLLAQCLDEGAFGMSTGLEYGPEMACPEHEIIELCKVVSKYHGLYATHTRNRRHQAHETIAEAVRCSAAADVPLQISHIQVVARLMDDGGAAMEHALGQVEQTRSRGLDVAFDMHTRLFGTTKLSTALAPWVLSGGGGAAAIAARLRDSSVRDKLRQYQSHLRSLVHDDWHRIVLYRSGAHPELAGKTIAQIGELMNVEPLDAVFDLLAAEANDIHNPMVLALTYNADDNRIGFEHPSCMIGSDATAMAPDGPLKNQTFHGAYSWAAWFYRTFVRDTATLSPPEAVRRLTSLPAQRLRLQDRGEIRAGAWADLAVFDPETFAERATTYQPNQTAAGMVHVVVNGTVAVEDGRLTLQRSGRVLRRV